MILPEPNWKIALKKLHLLTVYTRWLSVLFSWLTLGSYAIWQLRDEYGLWQDYFTWTAVRYALAFHQIAAFSLFFCLGLTGAALLHYSFYLIFGISNSEQQRLLKRAKKIYFKGPRHPLYSWLYDPKR